MSGNDDKLSIHAQAVNLARRWSVQNENDLMQEDFFEEETKYTREECQNMATHLLHPSGLPAQCKKYQDVVQYLKRHDTDTAHPSSMLS